MLRLWIRSVGLEQWGPTGTHQLEINYEGVVTYMGRVSCIEAATPIRTKTASVVYLSQRCRSTECGTASGLEQWGATGTHQLEINYEGGVPGVTNIMASIAPIVVDSLGG